MNKTLETLTQDMETTVQDMCTGKASITEQEAEAFGKEIAEALIHWSTPQTAKRNNLRMSNIGKPKRQLWFELTDTEDVPTLTGATYLRFLQGHILESLLLFIASKSGHTVEMQQERVTCNGINGSIDSVIDGHVVDVKTASPYGFKKFTNGNLINDDPFGYLAQLAGYEEGLGMEDGGFLVIDKSSCAITLYRPDDLDKPNAVTLIDNLKESLKKSTPPEELCYEPIPDGKAGNMKIARGCEWCRFKNKCHDSLRVFKYSDGYRYFTKVVKEPRVEEITNG